MFLLFYSFTVTQFHAEVPGQRTVSMRALESAHDSPPRQKTGIVATIGPASDSPDMLRRLIRAGMRVARLNFSHGEFEDHARRIAAIRGAAEREDTPVAVMADLPGPKIRLGTVVPDPWEVRIGESLILTVEDAPGTDGRVTVTFDRLPLVVARGDVVSLNDGLVRLRVDGTDGADVRCTVVTGGELRSRKGLNLPGLDLGIAAFTPAIGPASSSPWHTAPTRSVSRLSRRPPTSRRCATPRAPWATPRFSSRRSSARAP